MVHIFHTALYSINTPWSFLHLLFSLLFETKNTPTHSYSYVRTCHRGATSLMGKWINSSHISVLSSNKLHDKVCRPNFYCFKFISSLVQFHKCPLLTFTSRELSNKFSFITFLIEFIVNVSVSLVNTFLCFFWKRSLFPEIHFLTGTFTRSEYRLLSRFSGTFLI